MSARRSSLLRSIGLSLGAAALAPAAWLVDRVLEPPVVGPAIAAPRRVLQSPSAGTIAVYESDPAGDQPGVPVVLVHDVRPSSSTRELRGLFEALRDERPVIAVELPGWGSPCDASREPLAREGYASAIRDVIEDVARRRGVAPDVVAVGRSGELAAAAVQLATRHVRTLTLVSPTGFGDVRPIGRLASRALRSALRAPLARPLVHRGVTSRLVLRATVGRRSSRAADVAEHAAHVARRAPSSRVDAMCGALAPVDAVALYRAVVVPLLVVHGDRTPDDVGAIDRGIWRRPGARRAPIPGPDRLLHVERAPEIVRSIRAFVRAAAPKPQLRLVRGGGTGAGAVAARAARRPVLLRSAGRTERRGR